MSLVTKTLYHKDLKITELEEEINRQDRIIVILTGWTIISVMMLMIILIMWLYK